MTTLRGGRRALRCTSVHSNAPATRRALDSRRLGAHVVLPDASVHRMHSGTTPALSSLGTRAISRQQFCATGRKTKTSFHQKCTDGRMAWHVLVYGGIPRQKKENSFWVSDGAIPPPYSASSAVWRHPLSLRKPGCQFSAARLLSVAISIFCGHQRSLLIFFAIGKVDWCPVG